MRFVLFIQQIKLYWVLLFVGVILYGNESWKVYDDSEIAMIDITLNLDDLQWMYENVNSDSLHAAEIHFQNSYIDEMVDSIGFRLRGNTPRTSAKKSFKVDFNHFMPDETFLVLKN